MNTLETLAPEERIEFLRWVMNNNIPLSNDYDMVGFWKAQKMGDPRVSSGINPNDNQMHFTDMFKLPNHRTFSNESKYGKPTDPQWEGGPLPRGGESYTLRDLLGNVIESEAPWKLRGLLDLGE